MKFLAVIAYPQNQVVRILGVFFSLEKIIDWAYEWNDNDDAR